MGIFEDKVRKYNERMKRDLQLNDVHTCGIWGNLYTETGGFKHLQEIKPVVKGSRGGYGWLQWTGPRRKKYEAWAKAKGLNVADDETNYLYFIQETLTDEWKSLAQLRKTTTLEASTETFAKLNLRPGVLNLKHRLEGSRKAADALKSHAGTKTATAIIVAGTVATGAVYTPVNYLPYIAAGLAVVGVIAAVIYFMKGK